GFACVAGVVCGAIVTCETAIVSPRDGVIPARLATDFWIEATSAWGTDLSTMSATSSLFTLPGATTLRWIVLSTPNCVEPVVWLYFDWPPAPAAAPAA